MSYDSMSESIMLTMVTSENTGNASEELEATQNVKQIQVRQSCKLPRDMKPSKDVFEALGFIFEDIGDDIMYQATLPEGWKLDSTEGEHWTIIIDEKGRKRGCFFYKDAFYNSSRDGLMRLNQRFYITYDHIDRRNSNSPIIVCVKDSEEKVLFNAGQCNEAYSDEYEELMNKATEYLEINYPEWQNPSKYWN